MKRNKKMKCEQCKKIVQIHEFGGYLHYDSTKKMMDALVQKGVYEKTEPNMFEIHYPCKICHTIWILAKPDFPVKGYLIQNEILIYEGQS